MGVKLLMNAFIYICFLTQKRMMYGKEIWKIFILAVLRLGHSLQEITLPRAAVHHQAALALLRTKSQKSGMGREIALFGVHDTVTNLQKNSTI